MSDVWITWIIQGLTGLAVSVVAYYMKRDRDALDRKMNQDREAAEQRMDKQDDRIGQLEKEMKQLPFVYTTREDFIRAVTSLESKLSDTESKLDSKMDRILDRIDSIKGEAHHGEH